MDLREYLFRHRIRTVDFSKTTGLCVGYISQLKNGRSNPRRSIKLLISYATDQAVDADKDWGEEE